jgi:hypothetical protein
MSKGSTAIRVQVEIPNHYGYRQVAIDLVPTVQYALFNIKLSNDFLLAMTQYNDVYNANTLYEINIGGQSNTKSVIR